MDSNLGCCFGATQPVVTWTPTELNWSPPHIFFFFIQHFLLLTKFNIRYLMHSVNAVSHSHTQMHALSHTYTLVLISLLIMQPVSCSLRRGIWNELPQHPKGRGRWRERLRGRGGSGCYRTERGKASECSRLHSYCRVASLQRIGRGKEQEKQSPSSGVQWNESWSYQSLSAPDHLPRCSNLWLVLKPPGLLLLWLLLTHCCASDLLPLSLGASALSCRAHSSALIGDFDLGGYNIFDFCRRCTRSSKTENSRVRLPVSGEGPWFGGGHEPRVYAAVCFWLCRGSGGHQFCCASLSISAAAGSLLCFYRRLTCPAFLTLLTQTQQVQNMFVRVMWVA